MSIDSTDTAVTRSEAETVDLGRRLGERLAPGAVVALVGPLGAGKTRFVRGLAAGAGILDPGAVRSPTYVLHHVYPGSRFSLHHVDAYRLSGAREFEALDVRGAMEPRDVLVVEWADRVREAIDEGALWVRIAMGSSGAPDERDFAFGKGPSRSGPGRGGSPTGRNQGSR